MVLNVHRNRTAYQGRREGGGGYGGGGRGRLYTYRYTVTTRMNGRYESHFNISLIVKDKLTRQCPQTTTFEEKGEPKRMI